MNDPYSLWNLYYVPILNYVDNEIEDYYAEGWDTWVYMTDTEHQNMLGGAFFENIIEDTTANISISKFEIGKSAELAGATLTLTAKTNGVTFENVTAERNTETIALTRNEYDTEISFVSGDALTTLKNLSAGDYTLTETVAPKGYTITTAIDFTINSDGTVTKGSETVTDNHILVEDTLTEVSISKKEVGKTDELSGALITITANGDGADVSNATSTNDTFSKNANSVSFTSKDTETVIKGLAAGTYTLHEDTAPAGYSTTTDITFQIDKNGVVTVGENVVTNILVEDKINTMSISKIDAVNSTELSGAVLALTAKTDGITLENVTAKRGDSTVELEMSTDKKTISFTSGNAETVFSHIPAGEYTLTETTAPLGYTITSATSFTMNADGTITQNDTVVSGNHVLVADTLTQVSISKKDVSGTRELEGAVITITAKEDGADLSKATNSNNSTFQNDGSAITFTSMKSETIINGLAVGTYNLHEETAPAGFDVASDFTFTIDENGKVYVDSTEQENVIVTDAPHTVNITKTDITGTKQLEGATLELTGSFNTEVIDVKDSDGNAPKELTMTSGKISFVTEGKTVTVYGIADGNYTLTETQAPKNYDKAESISFEVKNGKIITEGISGNTVIMKDAFTKKDITVSKQDISGNEIADAKMAVYQADDRTNIIDNWTSVKDESHQIKGLEVGTVYVLVENTAPQGYQKAEEIFFKVDENGTVYTSDKIDGTFTKTTDSQNRVVMQDAYSDNSVTISKKDVNGENEVIGAELVLTNASLDWETVLKANTGKALTAVTTKETEEDEDIVIGVKWVSDGTDMTIVVENTAHTVTISKTDITGSEELENAKLTITGTFHAENITVKDEEGNTPENLKITDDSISYTTNGKKTTIYGIADGQYTLTEITAPEGYEKAEKIDFTIENGTVTNEEVSDNTIIIS
ncbi:MAG: SpaA isopeptide-forming pilin-related protein [Oscillospiraceae bacterium]